MSDRTHQHRCALRQGGIECTCAEIGGNRCGKPDPLGRPRTLAAGHAHPDDHSGEVRTHPRPIGRISPETEAFVRHLHGGDAVFKTDLDFQAEQILTRYALGISRSSPTG